MWTDTTRRQYARAELLLPSDLTDAEWAILEPLLPPRSKLGRPPVWDYRGCVAEHTVIVTVVATRAESG